MDKRLHQINDLLINYSLGNFDVKVELSRRLDDIDAFISGVNMLGEELKATTISRNYFNNIFHAVSDLLIVLNMDGSIQMINHAVETILDANENELIDLPISRIFNSLSPQAIREMLWHAGQTNDTISLRTNLRFRNKKVIDAECSINLIHNDQSQSIGYLIIARDLDQAKEYSKKLKKAENRYKKIFQDTSDAIFICDNKWNIQEMNTAGTELLPYEIGAQNNLLSYFSDASQLADFEQHIKKSKLLKNFAFKLNGRRKKNIDCLMSINRAEDGSSNLQGIIKDVSHQKELENIVLKTVLDTQENERKRLAKDLHDSLGQQLSALLFYVNTLRDNEDISHKKASEILEKSFDAISNAAAELRNVCFNLMPRTLENYGLIQAVRELCSKTELNGVLSFETDFPEPAPQFHRDIDVMLFRVIQEFINNSIKHANASLIKIKINPTENNETIIVLEDNGIGFDVNAIKENRGMGIDNIKSRLALYNAQVNIKSSKNKGTSYTIKLFQNPDITIEYEQE